MKQIFAYISALATLVLLTMATAHASLLWKVSGGDLDEPSYLFGTIHIICQDQFLMNERIENAFAESDKLVLEIDLSSPETLQRLQVLMVSQDGPYLDRYLDEDQVETLDAYFRENIGATIAQLGMLRPFALNSMVMVGAMGCADTASYELHFMELAHEAEKEINELETVDFQMQMFDDIPREEQVRWLWEMISDPADAEAQMQQMTSTYVNEDLDQLYTIILEDPQFAEYKETLLDERNRNWIEPIRTHMRNGRVFIAVGAGHLPGEQGVINLLREQGYQVEAVRN